MKGGLADIAASLIKHGADVNLQMGRNGESPLHLAAQVPTEMQFG